MNKHYYLTEQKTQKFFICFIYIIFNVYIVILLYALLILCADYHYHELQQLLYKAMIYLNSHSQELQSMIYFHKNELLIAVLVSENWNELLLYKEVVEVHDDDSWHVV